MQNEILDFLDDDDGHFLDQCCIPEKGTRERSISPFHRERTGPPLTATHPNEVKENRMLKKQVTFLSSQVTELNRTVRFQERLIDRLLTYLPVSTQEYTALVQKTATTTKSLIRSESRGVVERVDLGLPQDADLEGSRDSLP